MGKSPALQPKQRGSLQPGKFSKARKKNKRFLLSGGVASTRNRHQITLIWGFNQLTP